MGSGSELTFLEFIEAIRRAALHYLGEAKIPGREGEEVDLTLAQHNISILSLLQDKTEGNLSADEESHIKQALSDLHLKYVALEEKKQP